MILNSYEFFNQRTYDVNAEGHDSGNKAKAFEKVMEWGDKIPIGVIFKNSRKTYLDNVIKPKDLPLIKRKTSIKGIESLINELY